MGEPAVSFPTEQEEAVRAPRAPWGWVPPFLALYGLLGFVVQELTIFSFKVVDPWSWKGALVLMFVLALGAWRSPSVRERFFPIPTFHHLSAWVLVGVVASDFALRRFGFYSDSHVAFDTVLLGLVGAWFVSRRERLSPVALLFCVQVILTAAFLRYTEGRLIFSDDHPSFLYRLLLLREQFPFFPFYNTDWNLGYSAREFLPTGALSIFLVTLPVLYLFKAIAPLSYGYEYSFVIGTLFLWLVPWANYAAARFLGLRGRDALLVALFALGPSLGYFEWLLSFGTLGFVLSTGLYPLALVGLLHLFRGEISWRNTALVAAVLIGCLAWPLMVVAFLPLALTLLPRFGELFLPHRRMKVLFVAGVLLLFAASVVVPYFFHFDVLQFFAASSMPGTHGAKTVAEVSFVEQFSANGRVAFQRFRESLASFNPLLLVFFLPGIRLFRGHLYARILGATLCWLLFLALVGVVVKPQLELRRMVFPAGFLMALFAARAMGEFLSAASVRRLSTALPLLVVLGAVVLTPLSVGGAYLNRTEHRYVFAPEMVTELADAIREHGGEGRTFILGFILQDLGASDYNAQDGGHVALLPELSGKEMFAFEYYHSKWTTVDPIPRSFRVRGREGIEEFLDLVNATAVVTFRREWVDYCQRDSRYTQVWQGGRFRLYTRQGSSTPFLRGAGEVRRPSREALELIPKSTEVVLKYRYLDALRANLPGVKLSGEHAFDEDVAEGKTKPVFYIKLEIPQEIVDRQERIRISF